MQKVWRNIMFLYFLGLVLLHLGARQRLAQSAVNLIPFQTISRYILYHNQYNAEIIWVNLVLRFMVFAILGILVALAYRKLSMKKCWQSGLVIFLVTILLETLQYILKIGYFDVDAIILAVAGYYAGLFITRGTALLLKNKN